MSEHTPNPDLHALRRDYAARSLSEADAHADPIQQFLAWINEAISAKAHEPNAMTLATASPGGVPSARIVLLKHVDHKGFAFFTNYLSRKARDLEANPRGALVFFWPELERQVRVEGTVSRTSAEESDRYFHRRPPKARIGSAASPQSQVVPSRSFLEEQFAALEAKYPDGSVERPEHWGGYCLRPTLLEFWQGRPSRLHDRIQYTLSGEKWVLQRLAP